MECIQHRVECNGHVQQGGDAVLEAFVESHQFPLTAPRCHARHLAHAALNCMLHPRREGPCCLVRPIPGPVHGVLILEIGTAQPVRKGPEAVAQAAKVRLQHVVGRAEADGHVAVHKRQRLAAEMTPKKVEQVVAGHLRADVAHWGLVLHLLELLAQYSPVSTTL